MKYVLKMISAETRATCKMFDDECVCSWSNGKWKSYHKAMEDCLSDGGTLAYPTSESKRRFFFSSDDKCVFTMVNIIN